MLSDCSRFLAHESYCSHGTLSLSQTCRRVTSGSALSPKFIFCFHQINAATVAALPKILVCVCNNEHLTCTGKCKSVPFNYILMCTANAVSYYQGCEDGALFQTPAIYLHFNLCCSWYDSPLDRNVLPWEG